MINKISVIIPAYNEEKLLGRCLDSLVTAKCPEGVEKEIIVANNASTDKTKQIAESFEAVKVVDENRKGANMARQAGFFACSGDIIIFFDADNVAPANWFCEIVSIFEENPEIVAASGPYYYEDLNCVERFIYYDGLNVLFGENSLQNGFLLGGNCSVKREVLEKIGGWDINRPFYGDDSNLTRRVREVGPIMFTKRLAVVSSPRRFKQQGTFKTAWLYVINCFSELVLRRPVTKTHEDIR